MGLSGQSISTTFQPTQTASTKRPTHTNLHEPDPRSHSSSYDGLWRPLGACSAYTHIASKSLNVAINQLQSSCVPHLCVSPPALHLWKAVNIGRNPFENRTISFSMRNIPNSLPNLPIQNETQGRYPDQWPEWQEHSQEACKDQYDSYYIRVSKQPHGV